MKKLNDIGGSQHNWITIVNPTNQRLLLQAGDDCGVVKSENSVMRRCRARKGQGLVTEAIRKNYLQVV